jgi:hypothetical protein
MLRLVPAGLGLLALLAPLSSTAARAASEYDYAATVKAIAGDIAGLRTEFPQLHDFSAAQNVLFDKLAIDYAYHTHRYTGPLGGWVAHAPNPDDDGVWLYIDLHEPDSAAQIHTQPATPATCFGGKRATFLILEGKQTTPLGGRVTAILDAHGIKPCAD